MSGRKGSKKRLAKKEVKNVIFGATRVELIAFNKMQQ